MSSTLTSPNVVGTGVQPLPSALVRTARTTGLLYLGFFVIGVANEVVRSRLYVGGDPHGTLGHLADHGALARVGIALELGVVLAQALTALWFYRLFRRVDSFAAGALAAFGMVSAGAILCSAALLASALGVAQDTSLAAGGDAAATVQLLYVVNGDLWGVAAVFFGLWLLPMGRLALRSGWFPPLLGWVVLAGGAGYLVSAFVQYLRPDADVVTQLLMVPATIGELWMMAYLLVVSLRPHPPVTGRAPASA
jgi:hypothetical protein